MQIGFIFIILCILAFAIWANWRLLTGSIAKIIFGVLVLLNMGIFYIYVQQNKITIPFHGVFNQLVHYAMVMLGVKEHA